MATKFKEGVGWKRKVAFHTYAYAFNCTEVGVWAAAAITTSVASDIDTIDVVKKGAKMAAYYFVPAAPAYTILKNVDKAVYAGKKVAFYGTKAYKITTIYTAPINFFNSLGAKALTKYGVNEAIKELCGVEECDAFYWERPEYADRT